MPASSHALSASARSSTDLADHGTCYITLDCKLPETCPDHLRAVQKGSSRSGAKDADVVGQVSNDIDPQGNLNNHITGHVWRDHEHNLYGKIRKNWVGTGAGFPPHLPES
mmetsp:Transcript_73056/g.236467  ORF Transcript_73056/g.236467 Transcript_73056/m.236467 type:complete len:110 (-) Transcript_73056:229-558(-)